MPDTPGYYAEGPEALVVGLALRGDRKAFAELVRRRQPGLRGLLRRLSRDPDLADDLSQRVFLKVWQKIRSLEDPRRFGPWLKRIAVNEWISEQRRRAKEWTTDRFEEDLPAPAATPGMAMDLDAALATLPAPVRLCIVLSYKERLPHREIVEATGLPEGTVKSHIRRGSLRLRELLQAYEQDTATESMEREQ